jgi:hypothetical protein
MPDLPPNRELLPSLARLVRGLSALFWGLPVTLIVCVQTAWVDGLRRLNILPPVIVTGWLLFGLWELGHFQKTERVWLAALTRAKLLGLACLGLAPFLFWWNRAPSQIYFQQMALLFLLAAILFLSELNVVLRRLTAMLPDETLRAETRQFTALNRVVLFGLLALFVAYLGLDRLRALPRWVAAGMEYSRQGGLLLLLLFPLAMTMALLWKIKAAILDSVFTPKE